MTTHETILSTTDRLEAQSVVSMLASHGIEARLSGVVDSARLGVGDTALPLNVEVPVEHGVRAKQLLAASPEPDAEPADVRPNRKRAIIAVGVPLVWPGLAHVYAGHPWTGALLGLSVLVSLLSVRSGVNVGAVYVLLVLADAFFGVRAVQAFNRGQHRSVVGQVAAGVGLSLGVLIIASGSEGLGWVRHRLAEREFARYQLSCTAASLVIVNEGSQPRDLELRQVSIVATYGLFDEDVVSATFPSSTLHLEPGARAEVPLTVDPEFACAPSPESVVLSVDFGRPHSCSSRLSLVSEGHSGTVTCSHGLPPERMRPQR